MWKKTALAVGALAIALIAYQPDRAQAGDVGFSLGIGIGSPGWYYGGPSYHRPWRPHYRHHRHYRLSCGQASHIVSRHGYRKVRARDCRGRIYGFIARRHHRNYVVKVNSYNGRIVGRYRI